MANSGYVLNGVYHKVKKVPIAKMVRTQQSMWKQGDHARQRFDHSAEILQPYDHKGEPNDKFIEAYPEAAVEYGFRPNTNPAPPRESDITAQGSIPWGQVRP
jgi:hypothetical protein